MSNKLTPLLTQKVRAKKTLPRHLTCHLFTNNMWQVWIVIVIFCFNFYTISMCERTISLTRTRRLYNLMEFPNAQNCKHTWMMHMLYFDTSICWTIARSFCHSSARALLHVDLEPKCCGDRVSKPCIFHIVAFFPKNNSCCKGHVASMGNHKKFPSE
jgi:hypothetical protein